MSMLTCVCVRACVCMCMYVYMCVYVCMCVLEVGEAYVEMTILEADDQEYEAV